MTPTCKLGKIFSTFDLSNQREDGKVYCWNNKISKDSVIIFITCSWNPKTSRYWEAVGVYFSQLKKNVQSLTVLQKIEMNRDVMMEGSRSEDKLVGEGVVPAVSRRGSSWIASKQVVTRQLSHFKYKTHIWRWPIGFAFLWLSVPVHQSLLCVCFLRKASSCTLSSRIPMGREPSSLLIDRWVSAPGNESAFCSWESFPRVPAVSSALLSVLLGPSCLGKLQPCV